MVDLGGRLLVLVLLAGLCLAAGLPAEAAGAAEEYILVPVSVTFLPSVSLPLSARQRTVSVVALNLGAGYTDRLAGVEAGIVNLVGEDAAGIQAGVGNYVGGDLAGVQCGVVNVVSGSLRGLQSGVVNLSLGNGAGVQAGVVNVTGGADRAQLGVVNVAGRARGLQVGLINVARELEGAPLGLISIVLEGGLTHGQVWVDELGGVNAAFLHGSRLVYNVYTLGIDRNREWWSGGFGLGVHLPAGRSYLNLEATSSGVFTEEGWEDSGQALVHRVRAYLGVPVARRAVLFAGVSFNYGQAADGGVPELPPPLTGIEFPFSGQRHRFWPGLFAGLEF